MTATLQQVTKKKNFASSGAGFAVFVLLLCCGGTTVIGAIGGAFSDDKPTAATSGSQQTGRDALTTIPSPTGSASGGNGEASPAPTRTSVKPTPKKTTSKPTPRKTTAKPKPKKTTKKPSPAVRQGVHPGAFCSPAGARGRTSTGKLMVCKKSATDSRNRWRAA